MRTLLSLTMLLALAAAPALAGDGEWVGWLVDEKCAAKGANEGHADCAKNCVKAGHPVVLVAGEGKEIYKIHNQDAVKEHVGHKVTVAGSKSGDSIHVDSVKM